MAKTKSRKTQKKKGGLQSDVLVYIYALAAIAIAVIGCLKIGFVGGLLTSVIQYLIGTLYGVFYGVVILISLLAIFRKSWKQLPMQYVLAIVLFLIGWGILASIPPTEDLIGSELFANYLKNSALIFRGEIAQGGGLIGIAVTSLCTFLFDYTGTKIVVVALFLMAAALAVHGTLSMRMKSAKEAMSASFASHQQAARTKREQRKIVKEQRHKEKQEAKMADIRADDTSEEGHSKKEQRASLFMNVDIGSDQDRLKQPQLFEETSDHLDVPKVENDGEGVHILMSTDHSPQQDTVQEPVRSVVEEIIGKKDDFVSKFDIDYSNYKLPKISLLNEPGKKGKSTANLQAAKLKGKQLIDILEQFGVKATLVGTHIGPSITKFEVRPDLGVRVNKISNLQYDIKMALAAKDIRIEAPIPGKSAVGIEVPNEEKTTVHFKDMMRSIPQSMADRRLLFCLGMDLMGNAVYGELNKMPHLLVAGATGSGKSVCINSIICTILMRAKPDEVKMLLIDPKKVEFTPYHEVPHLIGPVITDGEEANRALKVIVKMMDDRYEMFAMAGVRNIQSYNANVDAHPQEGHEKLPSIVVIIDELADLMLVAAKEVEASIQRITQLARAAGIHLIVATQRPSVDVITGVIKANIPSRIAFAVSSAVDSRTILDQMGAEKLLGYGDMLYLPVGETSARRIQGVFVDDHEVARITEFCKKQGRPRYEDAFFRLEEVDQQFKSSASEVQEDPLYEEVRDFVIRSQKASTSLIQRKFSIGYARAARLIDVLEERGIIGPSRGSKPREVYAKGNDDNQGDY
ncbi:DNA translocase FtsK [Merdibacter massiliensis]|uniref:DNA translocase FtsK n=1 Tax=Merdibacter massiliensis TaxID=1871030 RepID=UPI00096A6CAB|nr:DNA translocase FtsK [Merdibacter massiliensis]